MKLPEKCPKCGVRLGIYTDTKITVPCLFIRSELNFDSEEDARIEDQIYECSECHTLFRARWELASFVELQEKTT